ncbi:MAG: flagellar biosynthetic protein FliO [Phycisphaerae bacterium]|nr:flagellar biosynthetic protein FliO [Phycisphaerae bacterium]
MKRRNLIILSTLLCCLIAAGLLAAPADSDIESQLLPRTSDSNSSGGGLGWELATILIALAVVIAAIYLLLRVLRRFFPALAPAGGAAAPVKPLARFHLAPRQTLHLVRCGSRLLLLGATSASINHIATIDDPAEIDRILQAVNRGQSPLAGLTRLFHRSSEPPSEKLKDQQ